MKKQLQFIFLFVSLIVFLSPKTSLAQLVNGLQGDGTYDSPVLIQSADDLKLFSEYVNARGNSIEKYFKLTTDIDFSDEPLMYDLDGDGTNESNFKTIGDNQNAGFKGFFDGNNCTISGLKIKSKAQFIGLFGFAATQSLDSKKIKIININIATSRFENAQGNIYLGSIAGCAQLCDLENCNASSVEIVVSTSAIAGGITAFNYGNLIEDCSFKGSITSTAAGATLGGIVGGAGQIGTFNRCYADVTISSVGDDCFIGGFAGSTHSEIINSYSTGTISVSGENCVAGGFVGGLVTGGNIYNSYSICSMTTENTSSTGYFGGFAGGALEIVSMSNNYFIDSWSNQIIEDSGIGTEKSESEMKASAFVTTLNNNQSPAAWGADLNNDNNGFPVLKSQEHLLQIIPLKNNNENKANISFENGVIKVSGKQLTFIQVTDVQGRIIKRESISGDYAQMELQQPTGIYIVTVGSSSYIQSAKFLNVR